MKIKRAIKQITKTAFVFWLITMLVATPILPAFQTPITPKIAEAAGESCSGGGGSPQDHIYKLVWAAYHLIKLQHSSLI